MTRVIPFRTGLQEIDWRSQMHAEQAQALIAADEAERRQSEERARTLDRLAFGLCEVAEDAARTIRPIHTLTRRGHFTLPEGPEVA